MHARIDQLLSVLDREPVDAIVHAHIEQCASCAAQLQRLTQTTEQLRALPQFDVAPHSWQQIAAQLPNATVVPPWWQRRAAMGVIAAGVLALAIAVTQWREPAADSLLATQQTARQPTVQQPAHQITPLQRSASVRQLVEESRELEQALEYLPQRPSVERVGMAATVDTIEQRVQWLDWQLTSLPDTELSAEQVLWRERVTLMDSLVKLRYAESSRVSF